MYDSELLVVRVIIELSHLYRRIRPINSLGIFPKMILNLETY